jgi:hypothetical protein
VTGETVVNVLRANEPERIVYNLARKTVRILNRRGGVVIAFCGVTNPDNFAHELARLVEADTPPPVRREVFVP